ncbi:hypothetical protein LIER_02286 [Lithospermum erythrorhizon]|uniref:F-box associated domain-containing protein n=1 Tax=Lithospermum erythrorhizon TaxID=34254 RepID=A0AAV3NRB8_LITER
MYREQPFYLHRVTALNQKPFGFLFAIDGLILEGCNATGTYRIRNHMSNQILELPDLEETYFGITSMGYASSTNEYKVLHLYWKEVSVIGMKILTAGVDQTWRPIHTPHTFYTSKNDETIYYTLDGIHYIMMYRRSSETDDQTNKIIGFKFEDESFIEFAMPEGLKLLKGGSLPWGLKWDEKLSVGCKFENQFHIWVLLENNYKNPKWDERRRTCSYLHFHTMKDSFVRSVSGDSASIKGGLVDFTLDIKSGKVLDFTHNGFMELRPSLVSFRGMKTRAD